MVVGKKFPRKSFRTNVCFFHSNLFEGELDWYSPSGPQTKVGVYPTYESLALPLGNSRAKKDLAA